jgi:hypothetical protein
MATIQHTLKLIDDLTKIITDILDISTHYSALGTITKVLPLKNEIQDLLTQGQQVLPEIKDLTTAEMSELGLAAYSAFKKILAETSVPKKS